MADEEHNKRQGANSGVRDEEKEVPEMTPVEAFFSRLPFTRDTHGHELFLLDSDRLYTFAETAWIRQRFQYFGDHMNGIYTRSPPSPLGVTTSSNALCLHSGPLCVGELCQYWRRLADGLHPGQQQTPEGPNERENSALSTDLSGTAAQNCTEEPGQPDPETGEQERERLSRRQREKHQRARERSRERSRERARERTEREAESWIAQAQQTPRELYHGQIADDRAIAESLALQSGSQSELDPNELITEESMGVDIDYARMSSPPPRQPQQPLQQPRRRPLLSLDQGHIHANYLEDTLAGRKYVHGMNVEETHGASLAPMSADDDLDIPDLDLADFDEGNGLVDDGAGDDGGAMEE